MAKHDYVVGYGKPPKHTQFKPGESGNPAGRPKGTKNFATDLQEELTETIHVTEQGQSKQLSKQRAVIKTLVARAMKGEPRATELLLKRLDHIEAGGQVTATSAAQLAAEDQAILEAFKQELKAGISTSKGGKEDE
jgi:hypothetical protein